MTPCTAPDMGQWLLLARCSLISVCCACTSRPRNTPRSGRTASQLMFSLQQHARQLSASAVMCAAWANVFPLPHVHSSTCCDSACPSSRARLKRIGIGSVDTSNSLRFRFEAPGLSIVVFTPFALRPTKCCDIRAGKLAPSHLLCFGKLC